MYTTVARVRALLGAAFASSPSDSAIEDRIDDADGVIDSCIRKGGAVPPTTTPAPIRMLSTNLAALLVLYSVTAADERLVNSLRERTDADLDSLGRDASRFGVGRSTAALYYADDASDSADSELDLP